MTHRRNRRGRLRATDTGVLPDHLPDGVEVVHGQGRQDHRPGLAELLPIEPQSEVIRAIMMEDSPCCCIDYLLNPMRGTTRMEASPG